ncbi:MAG: ferric reductase-like transmembrane domain-containing protein [Pseudomonadota bacterium]
MRGLRAAAIWALVVCAIAVPLIFAAFSPQLAWRQPVYIAAGFAGIVGLALMLLQPLLAGGILPGLPTGRGRRVHRWVGGALVVAVVLHVGFLWITSPPDVVDVVLFRSPTPFSVWGAVAMWAIFAAAALAALRKRLHLAPRIFRRAHSALVSVAVVGTVVHALLIQGTMETVSKVLLCVFVVAATGKVIFDLRAWKPRAPRNP